MDQRKNTMGIRNYFELNNNENTICKKLWDTSKAVLRGKFIAFNAHIRNEKKCRKKNQ